MGNKMDKFWLLMWKNWTLLKRRRIHTAFEILLPLLLCFILVGIRDLIETSEKNEKVYEPFDVSETQIADFQTIAYCPESPLLAKILNNICPESVLYNFTNSSEMSDAINNFKINVTLALQFDDSIIGIQENKHIPTDLNITIRMPSTRFNNWYTNLLYPVIQNVGPRDPDNLFGGTPYYYWKKFLHLQQALVLSIINNGEIILPSPKILLNRFPYPKWLDDPFYSPELSVMVSILLMMSFMYNYVNTIRAITTEKENQLKESMKIMGLPGWLHWLAWFTRTFILSLISVILLVIIVKTKFKITPVFTTSDGSVLFLFLLLFACSNISFSFFISVFFTKANTAAAVGSLVFFLSYLPFSAQQHGNDNQSLTAALFSSLMPNSALSFGITLILKFEADEEGVQWNNLCSSTSPDNNLTLGALMLMLLFDTFLFFILALYVEAIYPGEFGVPQKWYFPFTKTYWSTSAYEKLEADTTNNNTEYFEKVTDNFPVGIQLKNLSKKFGTNEAVKNLNLEMYEDHITVLLGHNGAGKTTTMSMITGMFPPSDGTAVISGYDIRTSTEKVRDSMGLCLQHNVLFDNLTVKEHLYFFGKLKGLQSKEIDKEIDFYLKLLELEDKKNAMSSTLSGGMKRKLSVGMALCGKSKVVMLDEPTAGMDPSARRAIWNLLQQQKKGRTILLTTHFMDEADLLGDRIAIMTAGNLQCCGSSFFLKRKYGAGYYLVMDVAPQCQPEKVTNLLKKHIPYVQVKSHIGSELTYQLSEHESGKFEAMLHDLEINTQALEVQSYGVSLTTLEEVFMKVGADHDSKISEIYNQNNNESRSHSVVTMYETSNHLSLKYLEGVPLAKNQIIATALKKFLASLRTWHLILFQVGLPIFLLALTILNARSYAPQIYFPSMEMTLDDYQSPVTVVDGIRNKYYNTYKNLLKKNKVVEIDNITATILDLTSKSPAFVKNHYIIAASFSDDYITAWFNGEPYHSIPLSLGAALNTLYKVQLDPDKSINFINYPLPLSIESQLDNLQFNLMGYQISIVLGYGMAFAASFYVLFCVKERISKFKHLQFVSGINVFIFWITAFLCDFLLYLAIMTGILTVFAVLQVDGFKTPDDLGRITLIFIYFGCHVIPFVYFTSYLFQIPSTGFSRIMLIGSIFSIIGITVMQVLEIKSLELLYVATPLHWALLFIPFYSVAKGIYDVNSIYSLRKVCSHFGDPDTACKLNPELCCGLDNFYSIKTPGIGGNLIISFSMTLVLFFILIINEFGLFSSFINKIINYNKPPAHLTDVETDVAEENYRIRNTSKELLNKEYILVLRDVTKYYRKFLAVNSLCLGVKPFECFGLLGVNGAGKTTTFKMMTGDEQISYGEAWVNGLNIKQEQKKVQKLIGYCPQFDALMDNFTARETLKMFALIRGVPLGHCKSLGEKLAHEFDFFKHLDKQVKKLSGGNKRKLSTALALIGDPPVIYLDEPTTGMDPATKRYLWTALNKLRDNGKCIILTSHSMEECEALCTRIAIMVNGTFQCIGSTQRLKNKFAQGFALTIKIKRIEGIDLDNDANVIDEFVKRNFIDAELKERYQDLLTYQLVNNSIPWSKMFGILEKSKRELNIEDYSLGQCSLEQVFLSFTKYQH